MAGSKPDLRKFSSSLQAAAACAAFIADLLNRRVAANGIATLAISGGSTPKPMFENLAAAKLDWSKIHIFWVDERCVPPDHEQSNFKMADATLLRPAGVPPGRAHRIYGELPPDEAAGKYVFEIQTVFSLAPGALPVFDLLHRGMGPDAHTASLFPGEPLIADRTGIAAHVWVEKMKMDRVTLLPGVLLAAVQTVLEVAGADKAEPLYEVLYGPDDPFRFPCQIATRGSDRAVWFLDEAAAAKV
jgi:6-phosphogluconolactonase